MNGVWIAMGLTVLAGMATGIGSIIAFTAKKTNYRFLSVATGFSAGVMLYVSFVEILHKGLAPLTEQYEDYWGHWINVASFFGGMLLIGIIDQLVPAAQNPHEIPAKDNSMLLYNASPRPADFDALLAAGPGHSTGAVCDHGSRDQKLLRLGVFTALVIGIHNFPEGLATFLAALQDPSLGVAIAGAIALHNIPEGISVSVPIFFATGDRK